MLWYSGTFSSPNVRVYFGMQCVYSVCACVRWPLLARAWLPVAAIAAQRSLFSFATWSRRHRRSSRLSPAPSSSLPALPSHYALISLFCLSMWPFVSPSPPLPFHVLTPSLLTASSLLLISLSFLNKPPTQSLSPCFVTVSPALWFIQWFREWKFKGGNKICFSFRTLWCTCCRIFSPIYLFFFHSSFTGKTGVFDVPESLDAMQTNLVVSNRLDPADLGSKARAI